MTRPEKTSARVARIAAKVLAHRMNWYRDTVPGPRRKYATIDLPMWRDIRALAASALTQAEDKRSVYKAAVAHAKKRGNPRLVDGVAAFRLAGPATIKKRPSSWPPSATGRGG